MATSQYDNARTGANLSEILLTPLNVKASQFGKLFSRRVDGDIYAQPLYIPKLEIPGQATYNVVFVATEHDSVYAFDGDGNRSEPIWQVSLRGAKGSPISNRDVSCPFIRPEIGITSTPVIDVKTGTLYVLARTQETEGLFSGTRYVQRLHALAITTGVEKFGGPVEIHASISERGGRMDFDPLRENPRAALLLVNGSVFLTWASSCDVGPYHGWVMAYDARTLKQIAVYNASPEAEQSGIWQGDAGPAADQDGNVFVATGNGKFDAASAGRDYGDSVLKLDGRNLELSDYFTPFNQEELNANDDDIGSGGPVLLPDQPGSHPHLLVVAGKGGVMYLIDRDRMGKYHPANDSHAVQTIRIGKAAFGAPAYWSQNLYYLWSDDGLKQFRMSQGMLSSVPMASSGTRFIDPGATPTVSANGATNGVVWLLSSKGWRSPDRPAVLYAYEAANVAHELYNSEVNSNRDRAGLALRFAIPTVANGHVYVGAKSELDVYGLIRAVK